MTSLRIPTILKHFLTPFLPCKCPETGAMLTIADFYLLAVLVPNSLSAGAVDTDLVFLPLNLELRLFMT